MFEANMIKPLTKTKSAYVPQNTALGKAHMALTSS